MNDLNCNGGENCSEELSDSPILVEGTIKPSHVSQQSPIDAARRPKMMETSVTASCIHSTAASRPPNSKPNPKVSGFFATEGKGRQTTELNNARSHASNNPFCNVNSLLK